MQSLKPQILLRVVVLDPPQGVHFAMQRGSCNLVPPTDVTADSIAFEFSVSVADLFSDPVRLTGEFAQGPPASRFVYINSGTLAGHSGACWTRRAKVPITGIGRKLVEQASRRPGSLIESRIAGKARDGGPACATVPLLAGWSVVSKSLSST